MASGRSAAEELSIAEQCDAKGEHDDAINALARATKMGDIEATTRLGKRLLVGTDAPLLPTEGARFLVDAVNLGGAEAAAKLAILAAAGIYIDAGLDNAFQLIGLAAQRGWGPAQSQLLALSPDRELAAQAANGAIPSNYWQALHDSVDLKYWTSEPAGETLHESPRVCAFKKLVPEPVCRWIIDRASGNLERALVYDAVGGKDYASHNRTNTCAKFDLMSCDLIHLLVQLRMQAACGLPMHNMEAPSALHYSVGEEITNHFDFVNPDIPNYRQELEKNGQRILTFLIYLNGDYEGGATVFTKLGVEHKGECGEGLFFVNALDNGEPDLRTEHAGCPPTEGEKWIITQFVRNRRVLGIAH